MVPQKIKKVKLLYYLAMSLLETYIKNEIILQFS